MLRCGISNTMATWLHAVKIAIGGRATYGHFGCMIRNVMRAHYFGNGEAHPEPMGEIYHSLDSICHCVHLNGLT